ncbi:MAG TPA: 4-hydroxythreonine-4-phosphate dehydrogenase PdxA [Desulfobacteraceae bacterium]|nr:4-hydroxythreonine-4-phosphate dehydrogenase PdxA [Desulfobacteraceae bacterium]
MRGRLPKIAITMGDPTGIGPEICIKALRDPKIYEQCNPFIIGDRNALEIYVEDDMDIEEVKEISSISPSPEKLLLFKRSQLSKGDLRPGNPNIQASKAMVEYIRCGVELAIKKEIDAIVTCPISKEWMRKSWFPFDGHTPYISHLCNSKEYVMMLAGEKLKITLVTIHCSLKDAIRGLTVEKIFKTLHITNRALISDFSIPRPKIAVCGVNPHAGEGGLYGNEEKEIIAPSVELAQREGMDVSGPYPSDTIFFRAIQGEFDCVVCMYHDQGLIPVKLLYFKDAVNITLGLPIVRTSVDHGTAYDIAGKGIADPSSLKSALSMAASISINRGYVQKCA